LNRSPEPAKKLETYQLEPQNFSIEQLRYIDRMQKSCNKQNLVYKQNIQKEWF
jgi:hypothetical protein